MQQRVPKYKIGDKVRIGQLKYLGMGNHISIDIPHFMIGEYSNKILTVKSVGIKPNWDNRIDYYFNEISGYQLSECDILGPAFIEEVREEDL